MAYDPGRRAPGAKTIESDAQSRCCSRADLPDVSVGVSVDRLPGICAGSSGSLAKALVGAARVRPARAAAPHNARRHKVRFHGARHSGCRAAASAFAASDHSASDHTAPVSRTSDQSRMGGAVGRHRPREEREPTVSLEPAAVAISCKCDEVGRNQLATATGSCTPIFVTRSLPVRGRLGDPVHTGMRLSALVGSPGGSAGSATTDSR
jgi:hypothetical protein